MSACSEDEYLSEDEYEEYFGSDFEEHFEEHYEDRDIYEEVADMLKIENEMEQLIARTQLKTSTPRPEDYEVYPSNTQDAVC